MKGTAEAATAEDLGRRGAWRFTREYHVEPRLARTFHHLYETAFGPLRVQALARQVLTECEFYAQMTDGSVMKYVAWDDVGRPVGLCTLTRRLESVPWISPEYFAHHYPEHWRRNAIWYFGFVLAHPSERHSRFVDQLIDVGIGELVAEQAICAWDMCAYNDATLGMGARLADSFQRLTGVAPRLADVQNYYTLDLT
nr:hypothetical protein [uncultured Friedmanniella sp.]